MMNRKQRRQLAKQKRKDNKAAKKGIINEAADDNRISLLMKQACDYHSQNKYTAAESCLREVITNIPNHTLALHNLSGILLQQGRAEEALPLLEELTNSNKATAPMLYYNLGVLYKELGQIREAIKAYKQAKNLQPDNPRICTNLSAVLKQAGYIQEAYENCQLAVKLDPNNPRVLSNLAVILCELERADEALLIVNKAIALSPEDAAVYSAKGLAYSKLNSTQQAQEAYEKSLSLDAENPDTHYNYGLLLERAGSYAAAIRQYDEAIRINSDNAFSYNGKGNCLKELADLSAAKSCYDQSIRLEPEHAKAHFNKALVLLLEGNFKDGWQEYLWRYKLPRESSPPYRFPKPHWCGEGFEGQTLLLHAEQGLGDTIQCLRYIPIVQEHGGKVLVQCQQPLKELIEENYQLDGIYHRLERLPNFDLHCPLLSLPGMFNANRENIPQASAYLSTSIKTTFERPTGFSVGIVWQGSKGHSGDSKRSIRLEDFEPLTQIEGVKLVSLQFDDPDKQFEKITWHDRVLEDKEWIASMRHTAYTIKQLDLVITVDTSVGHLAGALGEPVWVLLPLIPDWRWLMQGDTSHWYRSMRLFRQTEAGNWHKVIQHIGKELQILSSKRNLSLAS